MSKLSSSQNDPRSAPSTGGWWRHSSVWLLIAMPLMAVVVAALTSAYIAFSGADPVVSAPRPRPDQGLTQVPAGQARNHATTGVMPEEK